MLGKMEVKVMAVNRDKNGRFLPVNSEGGRTKTDPEVKEILKAATTDAAKKLVEFMSHKNPNIAMWAITELLNRVYGKPEGMSKIQISGTNNEAIIFRWINEQPNTQATQPAI